MSFDDRWSLEAIDVLYDHQELVLAMICFNFNENVGSLLREGVAREFSRTQSGYVM